MRGQCELEPAWLGPKFLSPVPVSVSLLGILGSLFCLLFFFLYPTRHLLLLFLASALCITARMITPLLLRLQSASLFLFAALSPDNFSARPKLTPLCHFTQYQLEWPGNNHNFLC